MADPIELGTRQEENGEATLATPSPTAIATAGWAQAPVLPDPRTLSEFPRRPTCGSATRATSPRRTSRRPAAPHALPETRATSSARSTMEPGGLRRMRTSRALQDPQSGVPLNAASPDAGNSAATSTRTRTTPRPQSCRHTPTVRSVSSIDENVSVQQKPVADLLLNCYDRPVPDE